MNKTAKIECYQHQNTRVIIDPRADSPVSVYRRDGRRAQWEGQIEGTLHEPELVRAMLQGKFRRVYGKGVT